MGVNGGSQEAKLELFLKQFVIKLKSEEMAQIIYLIDLINKRNCQRGRGIMANLNLP